MRVPPQAAEAAVMRLAPDASLLAVERCVEDGLIRECRAYNQRKPLVTGAGPCGGFYCTNVSGGHGTPS